MISDAEEENHGCIYETAISPQDTYVDRNRARSTVWIACKDTGRIIQNRTVYLRKTKEERCPIKRAAYACPGGQACSNQL